MKRVDWQMGDKNKNIYLLVQAKTIYEVFGTRLGEIKVPT